MDIPVEVLKERERCKEIVERKFNAVIKLREERVIRKRRFSGYFRKLENDIVFLIDNPDYVRVETRNS
jgi:hypothetical protein